MGLVVLNSQPELGIQKNVTVRGVGRHNPFPNQMRAAFPLLPLSPIRNAHSNFVKSSSPASNEQRERGQSPTQISRSCYMGYGTVCSSEQRLSRKAESGCLDAVVHPSLDSIPAHFDVTIAPKMSPARAINFCAFRAVQ